MRTLILKYPVTPGLLQRLPAGGEIRKVAFQHGRLMVWIEHLGPEDAERGLGREIMVIPTGAAMAIPKAFKYVDTAVSDDLVWHVYAGPVS